MRFDCINKQKQRHKKEKTTTTEKKLSGHMVGLLNDSSIIHEHLTVCGYCYLLFNIFGCDVITAPLLRSEESLLPA